MILLTHFDESYLAQGQCMLRSFMQHTSERFKICVLWLGERYAFSGDHNIEVVNLNAFMQGDGRLFPARENRSHRSFCWTLEPALVHSALKGAEQRGEDGEIIVYCDADMFWFCDPVPAILSIMEDADVALSPHRFPAGQEHRYRSVGKFNFGVSVMRACDLTRKVVGEWLDQTLEKCDEFAGGDQVYLDSWIDKLGMRLLELSPTWNAAPWQAPKIAFRHPTHGFPVLRIEDHPNGAAPLTSFHFHEFRRGLGRNPITLKGEAWNRSNYELHPSIIENVYWPYESALSKFL